MYLEPVQSFGVAARACASQPEIPECRADQELFLSGTTQSSGCGTYRYYRCRPKPVPAVPLSYDLTGTATSWSYPSCKTGYTRKASGKAHPNAYTCFASATSTPPPAATTPPPAATPKPPACPPSLTFENTRQQVLSQANMNAYQDHYSMQSGRSATSAEILKTLQPCPFYSQSATLYAEEYRKYIQSRPQIAYRR